MTQIYFRDANRYLTELADEGAKNLFFSKFDFGDLGVEINQKFNGLEGLNIVVAGESRKYFEKNGKKYPVYKFTESYKKFKELVRDNEYIFITNIPPYYPKNRFEIREKIEKLNELKGVAQIHIVGSNSLPLMLENDIDAMDLNPYKFANTGIIVLPNGHQMKKDKFAGEKKWIKLVGYKLTDLNSVNDFLHFNIKSMLMSGSGEISAIETPKFPKLREASGLPSKPREKSKLKQDLAKAREKSKEIREYRSGQIMCDVCVRHCDKYMAGSICMNNKDFMSLAKMFRTRDPELITDALLTTLAMEADRYQIGRLQEAADSIILKEVTDIEKALLKNGIEMLKVLNPSLRPVSNTLIMNNPHILAAEIMKSIDEKGVDRRDIDTGNVLRILSGEVVSVVEETS
jgi:hypothetical protein